MIQIIIDVLFILLMLGFLWLVLKELGQSQLTHEKYTEVPNMLRMVIDLRNNGGRLNHHAESLAELQVMLNAIPMFRIFRAAVWNKDKMTHIMDARGVLVAV